MILTIILIVLAFNVGFVCGLVWRGIGHINKEIDDNV